MIDSAKQQVWNCNAIVSDSKRLRNVRTDELSLLKNLIRMKATSGAPAEMGKDRIGVCNN